MLELSFISVFKLPLYLNESLLSWTINVNYPLIAGVLLGLNQGSVNNEYAQPDPSLPWLYVAKGGHLPCPITSTSAAEVYILAKQGKSLRYQLWSLDSVAQSNRQLRMMDPLRANDGSQYVVPEGGVEAGLAGQAVLLHMRTQQQEPQRRCSKTTVSSVATSSWTVATQR